KPQSLVGIHVSRSRPKFNAPVDPFAFIAFPSEISGILHGRNMFCNHLVIATKTAGGKDKGVTADFLETSVRTLQTDTDNALALRRINGGDMSIVDDIDARVDTGIIEAIHQILARPPWRDMHADLAMSV